LISPVAAKNTPFIKNKPLWTNYRRYTTENPISIKADDKTKFANQQDNLTRSIPQPNRKEEPKRKEKSTAQMISFSWAGIGKQLELRYSRSPEGSLLVCIAGGVLFYQYNKEEVPFTGRTRFNGMPLSVENALATMSTLLFVFLLKF
jgi:hypothetical protein